MMPTAVTVRYRYGEGGASRDASFYGLFFDRSEEAVLGRLKEAHRFATWIEVVDVQWRDGAPARADRRDSSRLLASSDARHERVPLRARCSVSRGARAQPEASTRECGDERMPGDGRWQVRRHTRCRMFKPAHVVLESAVLDCVLLDLSPGGAQVCLLGRAELPDLVTLWLPGGESRPMRRRWRRGSRIGFEAVGDAVTRS